MSYSVSDLLSASSCEFAAIRSIELKHGWRAAPCGALSRAECTDAGCVVHGVDEMMERLAQLGDEHERAMLASYLEQFGLWTPGTPGGVCQVDQYPRDDRAAVTSQAFADGADVLFQVEIQDGQLIGRADFVVRQSNGQYAVYDTKLARTARASAVLQITAYAQALAAAGVDMSRNGYLVLGSGEVTRHSVVDTGPVYQRLRARYEALVDSRSQSDLVVWGPPELGGSGSSTCGRCDECESHLAPARDVLLVMGCTVGHRAKLNAAGIYTVEDLAGLAPHAAAEEAVVLDRTFPVTRGIDMSAGTLSKLVAQAQLFLDGEAAGKPLYRVIDTKPFGLLRPESPGDIFFDFEGDPLYAEAGSHEWGLEYLFGWCTRDSLQAPSRKDFYALWAHNRVEEKRAFERFIDYLRERLTQYPDMHVYHYAPYETAALKRLAIRHGTREEELDQLLRVGLFVDLYAVVRGAMRTSGRSLSIKKLEPFYLDAIGMSRAGVTNAADSITEYAAAKDLKAAGDVAGFDAKIALLEDYNRYDCESTFHLLNWLGGIADVNQVDWRTAPVLEEMEELVEVEPNERLEVAEALRAHLDRISENWMHAITEAEAHGHVVPGEPEARMIARMAWAAIDYYQRENKQYWWAHFARLSDPVDEWTGSDIFRPTRAEVVEDWHVPARARTQKRRVRLYGELEQGSKLRPGSTVFAIYDDPVPLGVKTSSNGIRGYLSATIEEIEENAGTPGVASVTLLESTAKTNEPWMELPMGVGPGAPIATKVIDERLLDFGREVLGALDANPENPDFGESSRIALLKRLGTAVHLEDGSAREGFERIDKILASLRSVENGVVAVQGPPGAGKTFVASSVITTLAKTGWKIGVVAQSHAVVENVLHAVLKRGLPKDMVAKKMGEKIPDQEPPFTPIDAKSAPEIFANLTTGIVTGGTAWTYCTLDFNPEGGYDLIVIDEAGQYSMANSLAVTHAAKRVLLLGDPQQLPQVSQGNHPEPVNESALAWLVGDDPTISEERGFFLDQTWRMHPDLTEVVSELSYEGKLHSVPVTAQRYVEGLEPGLHTLLVGHSGNVASSEEEAALVVQTIKSLLGKQWQKDNSVEPVGLQAEDFIVVAPYNAQVQLLKERLEQADLADAKVGTVDKFQGQEAAIALVSLAVSDAEGSPRGLEFVRNRNRLNVSISRGQHSAFLVHSPALLDAIDFNVKGMEEHGAFIRLSEAGLNR